jgi:hypothetical protein
VIEERRSYLNLAINLVDLYMDQLRESQTVNSQNNFASKNLETTQ